MILMRLALGSLSHQLSLRIQYVDQSKLMRVHKFFEKIFFITIVRLH